MDQSNIVELCLFLIKKYLKLFIFLPLLISLSVFFYIKFTPPTWESTATLQIGQISSFDFKIQPDPIEHVGIAITRINQRSFLLKTLNNLSKNTVSQYNEMVISSLSIQSRRSRENDLLEITASSLSKNLSKDAIIASTEIILNSHESIFNRLKKESLDKISELDAHRTQLKSNIEKSNTLLKKNLPTTETTLLLFSIQNSIAELNRINKDIEYYTDKISSIKSFPTRIVGEIQEPLRNNLPISIIIFSTYLISVAFLLSFLFITNNLKTLKR